MVRFKVEAVQLHWVAADNHVIQSRQKQFNFTYWQLASPHLIIEPFATLQSAVSSLLVACPLLLEIPRQLNHGILHVLLVLVCKGAAASWQVVGCPRRRFLSYQQWLPTHCEKPGWWNLDQDQARTWQRALLLRVGAIFTVFGWKLACQRCPLCFPAQDQRWCSADEK